MNRILYFLVVLSLVSSKSFAQDVIYLQRSDSQSVWGPSQRWPDTAPTVNAELADDFDVVGSIAQVNVAGYNSTHTAYTQADPLTGFLGVYVRFYEYGADGAPGALQAEYFIEAGGPNFVGPTYDATYFQMALNPPFQATGRHFMGVQAVLNPNPPEAPVSDAYWYPWSANTSAPRGQVAYFRDMVYGDGQWSHDFRYFGTFLSVINADLAFAFLGTRVLPAPSLTGLSTSTLARAGRFHLTGDNFGAVRGTGRVTIGGVDAFITQWSDTRITAYVAEGTPLGAEDVRVVTTGGTSAALPLNVTPRQADGRVQWRFQADGLYILSPPRVMADGTILTADINGTLYALAPDGGIRWIFRTGSEIHTTVSLGPDQTIYFAGQSIVYALNPDGTVKWRWIEPSGSDLLAGPNVGPDGNIYLCSDLILQTDTTTASLGAIILSPQGERLWNLPGFDMRFGEWPFEVAFGPPLQWYFTTNSPFTTVGPGLNALSLGGGHRWTRPGGGQALVRPNGDVTARDGDPLSPGIVTYDPDGNMRWHVFGDEYLNSVLSDPGLAPDGVLYAQLRQFRLGAVNPDGSVKWVRQYMEDPIRPTVRPDNALVVMGGFVNLPGPYSIWATDTAGDPLWRVELPQEQDAWVLPMTMPRFSPDHRTAYIGTSVNNYATDPYCYLYAIDTASGTSDNLTGLVLAASTVLPGTDVQAMVSLDGTAAAGGVEVTLTSTDPGVVSVPATVTIPAGSAIATFTVTTGGTETTTPVRITATHGAVTRAAELSLSANLPGALGDVIRALRLAGGLATSTDDDLTRLDVSGAGGSSGRVDITDALRLARRMTGLDPP